MLHLVTGYAGEEHITSKDEGSFNISVLGNGNYVLDHGNKFAASISSNNLVLIKDGDLILQGRHIRLASDTTEELGIVTGNQGYFRNDLICVRYSKNTEGVETAVLAVITGTETTSTPADPSYTTGSITDGSDSLTEFPLYRVELNGLNISKVTQLFSVKKSLNGIDSKIDGINTSLNEEITKIKTGATKVGSASASDTASKLSTAKTINGVAFDGTQNITVEDNTKIPKASDFILINKQNLSFVNNVCTITNASVTADSLADVYFTKDCAEAAKKALITVETYDGSVVITAGRTPEATLKATIKVRVI